MKRFALGIAVAVAWVLLSWRPAAAHESAPAYLQLAILDIDPARADAFTAAAAAHVAAASRAEPDLLALYAVSAQDTPGRIRVLEIYANEAAYRAHLASAHYQTFAATISPMVTQRQLVPLQPVFLGSKAALPPSPQVRVAELTIAPDHLAAYTAAVSEEISDSIRLEPGVIAIHAMSLASDPNRLVFLEIYADEAAYQSHIASPHFKKYVAATASSITARQLTLAEPVVLYKKASPVPAIYVSEFEITDPEGIKPYSAGVDATFAPFGGRYIVRGGTVASLEGGATKRVVMIQFPSLEQARAWYDSPAYQALRPIRHRSATSKVFIVNGVPQ